MGGMNGRCRILCKSTKQGKVKNLIAREYHTEVKEKAKGMFKSTKNQMIRNLID